MYLLEWYFIYSLLNTNSKVDSILTALIPDTYYAYPYPYVIQNIKSELLI